MNKHNVISSIAWVTIVAGCMVVIGWMFDVVALKSIVPGFVTMKFTTAISFIFSGIMLVSMEKSKAQNPGAWGFVLLFASLLIIFLMATLLIGAMTHSQSGLEQLFILESSSAVLTIVPGLPSLGTMLNFLLVSLSGISLILLKRSVLRLALRMLGFMIAAIGAVAVLGYITGLRFLYYSFAGVSTAMALHTSLLFVVLGVGIFLFESEKQAPASVS